MDNICPNCGRPDGVAIVSVPNHEIIWGGAREGEVGKVLYITDEFSKCETCEEEWYTPQQGDRRDEQVRIARGLTMEERQAEREKYKLRRTRPVE